MSKRTTMVLGGIAIAMLAYIVLFERGTLSTGELEGRHGRVIETFVRARVTRIEIEAGEHHILLTRAAEEADETLDTFGVGEWSLETPVHAAADGEAVDGLMSTLEWLDARRTLEGISDADRDRFGFGSPRATVGFTVANETHQLIVGGDDPRGEGLYVTLDQGDTAWICGRDLLDALQYDADHFRNKDLFRHFRPRDARHVELTNTDTHVVAERSEHEGQLLGWRLVDPVHAYARSAAIDGLLQFATHARATRFLAEEPGADLPAATRELRIERAPAERGATGEDADRSPLRLRIVGACPDHADELQAIVNDGPVVCILASDVEPLDATLDQLREMRLVSTPDDRVESITLTQGEESFTLSRHEGDWQIGAGEDAQPADDGAVGELMRALRAEEAQELVPLTDALVAQHGLTTPSGIVTITRTDDAAPEIVAFGASDALGVWVRRGDEEQVARFDLAARDLIARPSIAFRLRRLVERDADDATEIHITRGTVEEVAAHGTDGWHLSAPSALVADDASVRDVTRAVAGLEAVRFEAASAAPAHGLAHPRTSVTVHFAAPSEPAPDEGEGDDDDDHDEGPIDVTLRIGAATDGGAFATLGEDPAVFVVSSALLDALAHPLVSHDLLAVPTGDLSALTITGPDGTVALREEGDGWVTDLGPAASGPTTAMLDRLSSLHASGVEPYGTTMSSVVITVVGTHRSGASPTTLEIGPLVAGGEAAPYRLARITDVPVVFRLPDEAATAFADYRP